MSTITLPHTGVLSLVAPKTPTGQGWTRGEAIMADVARQSLNAMGYAWQAWHHRENGLLCISAVETPTPQAGQELLGPEYHLSVSAMGKRCTSADALWALAAFDLLDATEDNHVPFGVVRNFWRPVADRLSGYECPCQDSEPVMRENKGDFVWRGVTR